jgi:hypothetical protein
VLVAAAVCPHPPLLVPEIGGAKQADLDGLRAACAGAIEAVRATEPEMLVVVGAGETTRRHRAGARGTFRPYGVDLTAALPGKAPPDEEPLLPLSLSVGAWLLEQAAWTGDVQAQEVAASTPAEECRQLGLALAESADRLALLVMGDGTAGSSASGPGAHDPRAADFDASVVEALRAADPSALLAIEATLAAELGVAGRVSWQVLAGAAGEAVLDAVVLYDGAPYGVRYVVAVWERHG